MAQLEDRPISDSQGGGIDRDQLGKDSAHADTFDQTRAKLAKQRKRTFGIGLLKGMAVTIKHLFSHNTVIEYPDEVQDLSPRTRGVIALKEENCTVCMLCARECPDWCIYIDSHKEQLPPKRAGGRQRKRNVLDRFAIDYALCMYCGICVEVCPYDALFWSREFEYAEFDIRELTHEKERLSDWMASVLPPPPLEEGAMLPGQPEAAGTAAVAAGGAGPGSAQRPSTPAAGTAAAERPEQAQRPPAAAATAAPTPAQATPGQEQAGETKESEESAAPSAPTEEARTDTPGGGTPTEAKETDTAQPEAIASPTEAASPAPQQERAREASGDDAGRAAATGDDPGRAAATGDDPGRAAATGDDPGRAKPSAAGAASTSPSDDTKPDGAEVASAATAPSAPAPEETPTPNVEVPQEEPRPVALEKTEDPETVYNKVLEEQRAAGASPQVAEARAKVARVKAERGIKRGRGQGGGS